MHNMEEKINNIQAWILVGFCGFYVVAMIINAIQAIAGTATLATWHYPFLFGTLCLTRASLSHRQICAALITFKHIRIASKRIIRKVAKTMLCTLRALRSLPALFIESYRNFRMEESI